MLDIALGLYQAVFEYPGRSPMLLVYVTPALQWKHIYCPSEVFLMFDRSFPLMKAFHVNLLPRRHQFSSIPDYFAAANMVSPTCIMLALPLLCDNASMILSVIGSVCKTFCDEL